MKVTRVSTAVMEANFNWTIVKVETDEKIAGYGEAFLGAGLCSIIREYGEILIGVDPTSIDVVLRRLRGRSVHMSPGIAMHAINGIECALLDLLGKKYKMPVWQMLGGKYRDRVRVYADCHAGEALESITPLLAPRTPEWMLDKAGGEERKSVVSLKHHGWDASTEERLTPESYARHAREMVARGFRVLKFDVDVPTPYETDEYNRDLSQAEIEYMAALVGAAREAVGKEIGLAIDCHWNYSVQAAIEFARAVEKYKLLWLEDPVPPENIRATGQVQRSTRQAVATGENHYNRIDFERLILEAGLRVLAPDVQKVGLWEGRKLADLADMHYVNIAWHNISSPIGTMAGAQLCTATPNFLALEWHAASVPFFDELIKDAGGPLIENGSIRIPDRPGLGIEPDEEVVYKYRKRSESFF